MNTNLKVISQRVIYLREIAKELKKSYKRTNNKLLEDLYLELNAIVI